MPDSQIITDIGVLSAPEFLARKGLYFDFVKKVRNELFYLMHRKLVAHTVANTSRISITLSRYQAALGVCGVCSVMPERGDKLSDRDRLVEIIKQDTLGQYAMNDRWNANLADEIMAAGFGDVYELKCILQTQDEQIKGKDERIQAQRKRIEELEAIAERAGDVEGMKKTIKLAKDIKVPLAEFIVRCLTGRDKR